MPLTDPPVLVLQGFALDYSELREYTHGFLGHTATTLGADFAQVSSAFRLLESVPCRRPSR